MADTSPKTVAIVGGGPVGLAAAAHALARGLRPIVLEAGPSVGHAVLAWGHVPLFSPWEYNIDTAAGRLLAETGWTAPDPQTYPTGAELVAQYLHPLVERTEVGEHVRLGARVTAISRKGFDKVKTVGRDSAPFVVRYQTRSGEHEFEADAAVDASGTWWSPNPAGVNGTAAIGEHAARDRIAYGMPDVLGAERARYAGRRVAVLGAGHSAIGTLIDLARLAELQPATKPVWLLRGARPEKAFGGGANDKLAARGDLGATFARLVGDGRLTMHTGFAVSEIATVADGLEVRTNSGCCSRHVAVDELVVATGFRPDFTFAREVRLALDPALECAPALAPLIDPNEHSCGTVRPHGARELSQPERGFYIAGMKSYGRAPTFLMMTGYEQVRSIMADISGDKVAAGRVELVLPETGVCNGPSLSVERQSCCSIPVSEPLGS